MILYTAVFLVLLAADQILKFWVTQYFSAWSAASSTRKTAV